MNVQTRLQDARMPKYSLDGHREAGAIPVVQGAIEARKEIRLDPIPFGGAHS